MTNDDSPTVKVRIQHSPEGATWTTIHPDGATSVAVVERFSWLWWKVTIAWSDQRGIEFYHAPRIVFGTHDRARRKADRLHHEWTQVREGMRQDFAEGFARGLRASADEG